MNDTPLIRRQVTTDRGVKAVTTHEVLACIKELTVEQIASFSGGPSGPSAASDS